MEERSEDFQEALSNIARQARSLLQNFNDGDVQLIEKRMLDQMPREYIGASAYEQEHATPLYFCHGVFIDRFIFKSTLL